MFLICLAPMRIDGAAYAAGSQELTALSVSEFDYTGETEEFINADGGYFGMYSRQDGSSIEYKDGKIVIEHVTKNTTIYKGFYLKADAKDSSTWKKSNFIERNEGGWLSFELDEGYAGKAWPIAPVKVSDETASTSGQYYLGVPPLELIPGYSSSVTVTFVDGWGNVLSSEEVQYGGDAEPPDDPVHDGYVFQGWDKSYENVTEDTTVTALWSEEGKASYVVKFVDGWGAVLKTEYVTEGSAATAPDDPTHEGYTFTGWDPASFDDVDENLTVTAQWVNNDDVSVDAVKDAIAALPSDSKALLGEVDNEGVSSAAAVYLDLSDSLKERLSDDERLRLARCAIAVLPSDPFDVTRDHKTPINAAQSVFESLPDELQEVLDSEAVSSSRTYGRYLENAVWALDSLRAVNNVTLLSAGTYTGQVTSSINWGKLVSARKLPFTITSVTVKGGTATAVLEHSSNSSQTLRLGGKEYTNLQTDMTSHSYFEIPINLNSTFHFSVKGKYATDDTDAISYEMTVSADLDAMTPDPAKDDDSESSSSSSTSSSSTSSSSSSSSGSSSSSTESSTSSSSSSSASETTSSSGENETSSSSSSSSGGAQDGKNGGDSGDSAGGATGQNTGTGANLNALVKGGSNASALTASTSRSGSSSSRASNSASATSARTSKAMSASTVGRVQEANLASPASQDMLVVAEDLKPAVVGVIILFLSLGALVFTLRFVKREAAFAEG